MPEHGEMLLNSIAEKSYRYCCDWFGSPTDANIPYDLLPSHKAMCVRSRTRARYYILFHKTSNYEAASLQISHDMFHRVVYTRENAHAAVWKEELLACMTAHQILHREGMGHYALAIEDQIRRREPQKVDVPHLMQIRISNRLFEGLRRDSPIPISVYDGCFRLGQALLAITDWQTLCLLNAYCTYEEWLATLPADGQQAARCIFNPELCLKGKSLPTKFHHVLGVAFRWLGNYDAAILELQKALTLNPLSINSRYELSLALYDAERVETAIEEMRRVSLQVPRNANVHFALGNFLKLKGDTAGAIRELEHTVNLEPQDAAAYYYLGEAFHEQGDMERAKNAWTIAIRIGDATTAALAQKALNRL